MHLSRTEACEATPGVIVWMMLSELAVIKLPNQLRVQLGNYLVSIRNDENQLLYLLVTFDQNIENSQSFHL